MAIDDEGAEVRFNNVPHTRIRWSRVKAIDIVVDGYEAWWRLTGDDEQLVAPVEEVAGFEEFNARLFSFPGFDKGAYEQARRAEAQETEGEFNCWTRLPNMKWPSPRPRDDG